MTACPVSTTGRCIPREKRRLPAQCTSAAVLLVVRVACISETAGAPGFRMSVPMMRLHRWFGPGTAAFRSPIPTMPLVHPPKSVRALADVCSTSKFVVLYEEKLPGQGFPLGRAHVCASR